MRFSFQSDLSHQLDDKLGEVEQLPSMEVYDLSKENELDTYMSREVPVPEGDKNNLVKAKKIMVDSITNQLVPQVSSLKTPKMFDSLIKKNIHQKTTLRN